ncbi:MAG: hypothetical protein H6999_12250 [Hahellaceae bacterium]|nr:hypothetical protein [Hahellaceae bacterium]MCP5170513.1 hypothetical protein [Hahellaceae bacterium]
MKSLDDNALSSVHGQAYFAVDQYSHPDPAVNANYMRLNLGLDIETMLNAETLELGRYDRSGEKPGSSDVLINNFGLGYIYDSNFYSSNPDAVRPVKSDGSGYLNGEIVPFQIHNPFLEFAFDETSGIPIGMRIGFGDSQGMLSGNIKSLTGNVNVDIIDHGEGLSDASSSGNFFDQIIVLLTPLLEKNSPIHTKGQLVDNQGNIDPIRAEMIGVPDGEKFVLEGASSFTRWSLKNLLAWGSSSEIDVPGCSFFNCPGGDIIVTVQDCKVLGIDACFDLSQYNSFPIGEVSEINGKRYLTGPSPGLFLSFQTKNLAWLKETKIDNPQVSDFIQTTSGAFFNVPNSAVQVNLYEALYGTDRVRGEYIDRGLGLF